MGKNFLGLDGLKHFWSKAKTWIAEQITAEVTAKIAEVVAKAPEDLDTLKEIADWIKNHANDAAAMNAEIKANKTAISGKADKIHTHTKSEITDFDHTHDDRYYTESEVDTKLSGKSDTGHTHTKSQITDFAHTHDDRYFTETEVTNKLAGKSDTGHTHDDRYFTETEVTNKLAGKSDTGHTHTKSQITDFPTSLPANGGTADRANNGFNSSVTTDSTPGWGYLTSANGYSNGRTYSFANGGGIATAEKDTKSSLQVDGDLYVHEGLDKVATLNDIPTSLPANGGTADKTVNDITIDIPFVTENGQYVIPLGNILEPTSTETKSPYNWDITGFFSIIRPAGHNGSHLWFEAGHGYSHDWTTYAYLDKLDFKLVTTSLKAFQYEGKWWLGLCIITSNQVYTAKMTITYSRGLPATPTCILYNSGSDGVANEEIHNSIQDIPSSWWKTRTICNPTSFSNTLYANGVIEPRLGTYDGSIVSIGRDDGNIAIGDTSNNNRGNTVINNDCKMRHDLGVFGESNFVGPCYFNDDIFVHNKSLFPSGYIPRTYYINKQFADITDMTTVDKTLLKKFFAFLQKDRCVQVSGWLYYKVTITSSLSEVSAPGIGFVGYQDYGGSPIVIDDNNNITVNSDYSCNFCMVGGTDDEGNLSCWDLFLLADTILNNKWSKINNLRLGLTFTLLEKV